MDKMLPYDLLRPLLFALPAEVAHAFTLNSLDMLISGGLRGLVAAPRVEAPLRVMGLEFANAVGLAAGLDKNGEHIDALAALGFGSIEIGTVTPRPQPGNPSPRLFRLPQARALINRMGFNNKGVEHLCRCVARARYRGVLGINIGKNKDTPAARAAEDYVACLDKVYPLASYIAINLSSPNTPGLRDLQFGEPLEHLLRVLVARREELAQRHGRQVPLALKIAPDMADDDLDQVADCVRRQRIDALIATNTTLSRDGVGGLPCSDEPGGLSGLPLRDRAAAVAAYLARRLAGEVALIGVGGIMSGEDAADRVRAGAQLVQIYTGFIYRGPRLVAEAADAIARLPPEVAHGR
jgi:dihydroorotate dehydrogenase